MCESDSVYIYLHTTHNMQMQMHVQYIDTQTRIATCRYLVSIAHNPLFYTQHRAQFDPIPHRPPSMSPPLVLVTDASLAVLYA